MQLFDDYEAVKFPEENVIFITHNGFLYYFYQPRYPHRTLCTENEYPWMAAKKITALDLQGLCCGGDSWTRTNGLTSLRSFGQVRNRRPASLPLA